MQHLTCVLLQEYHRVGRHWEGGRLSSCTLIIIIWLQVFAATKKRGTWEEYAGTKRRFLRAAASELRETEKEADIWRYVMDTRRDEQRLSFELYVPYLYYRIVAC